MLLIINKVYIYIYILLLWWCGKKCRMELTVASKNHGERNKLTKLKRYHGCVENKKKKERRGQDAYWLFAVEMNTLNRKKAFLENTLLAHHVLMKALLPHTHTLQEVDGNWNSKQGLLHFAFLYKISRSARIEKLIPFCFFTSRVVTDVTCFKNQYPHPSLYITNSLSFNALGLNWNNSFPTIIFQSFFFLFLI